MGSDVRIHLVPPFLYGVDHCEKGAMSHITPKLLDQLRYAIRSKHYSYRTEQTYSLWVKQFILFHNKRHPAGMGKSEIEAFLSYLAVQRKVSASTQNQAMSAILFLYRHVLGEEPAWLTDVVRAKTSKRVPVVFSPQEAKLVLRQLEGAAYLAAALMYGSGLRVTESVRLRVKDCLLYTSPSPRDRTRTRMTSSA